MVKILLNLIETDCLVVAFPVPARNIEEVRLKYWFMSEKQGSGDRSHLVLIMQQLDNAPSILAVILHRNDSHNVRSILPS